MIALYVVLRNAGRDADVILTEPARMGPAWRRAMSPGTMIGQGYARIESGPQEAYNEDQPTLMWAQERSQRQSRSVREKGV